jgi:hypothetical protein
MGIRVDSTGRSLSIFGAILLMLAGLFLSRAVLSIALMLFVALALLHKNIGAQLRNFFKTPLLAGMALLFLLPFVSGLWSADKGEWLDLVRIKLPLLFLPLAFAGNWQLPRRQWRAVALFFLALVAAGTAWSFEKYWTDRNAVAESYLKAKVFLTPLQNDHVRFSWMVAVAVLLCLWFVETGKKWQRLMAAFLALWFSFYLHLLAARTGLLSLYLVLLFYAGWKLFKSRNKAVVAITVAIALAMPLLAWYALPTFQNRIKYFMYDHSFIRSGAYLPGGNDGNRVLSYRAGWHLLKNNPLGVGAGDVFAETNAWYREHVPGMQPSDKLYPNSEWLLYGGSAGWPGVLIFTGVMLLPLFYQPPVHRWCWLALSGTAAATFLFDIGLEVQFGVFLYAFLLLWWWKWFWSETENSVL